MHCRVVLTAIILSLASAPGRGAIWYVTDTASSPQDGRSWQTAFHTISGAINAATSGDEIWVAKGRYTAAVVLKPGVRMLGGFAGWETKPEQRNWKRNKVTLTGDRLHPVVSVSVATRETLLDGFTLRNGSVGVYCVYGSPTIAHNVIVDNAFDYPRYDRADGGGVLSWESSALVCDNVIVRNATSGYGGGVLINGGSPVFVNNTIAVNSALKGGSVYVIGNANTELVNNIVAFNSSGIVRNGTASLTLRNNCFYANGGVEFTGLSSPVGRQGNIQADPKFADWRHGDIHLMTGSPCIDAGDNSVAPFGDLDMDGDPRIAFARRTVAVVDMGADEAAVRYAAQPPLIVRVAPNGSDANNGLSWRTPVRTVQHAIDLAAERGGDVWVAKGSYAEGIKVPSLVGIYGGFRGDELSLRERNPVAYITVIESPTAGSPALTVLGGGANTVVNGFTFVSHPAAYTNENPVAVSFYSSPTISNNSFRGGPFELYGGTPHITSNSLANGLSVNSDAAIVSGNYVRGGILITGDNRLVGPKVANNVIAGASRYGLQTEAAATIVNNTIVGNGDGVRVSGQSILANNLIAFNGSGVTIIGTPKIFRHNCVYGNDGGNYGTGSDLTGKDGNISTDPHLAAPLLNQMRIQADSPCRDSGDDTLIVQGTSDMLGRPRVLGAHVDIGAYESDGRTVDVLPSSVIRVSISGSDANDGSSWPKAKRTIQAAIDAIPISGAGEIRVAKGVYPENVNLPAFTNLLGGFDGSESARNPIANETIVDGGARAAAVKALAGYLSTVIDGFTIRNAGGVSTCGKPIDGGGISCGAAVIRGNRIAGNATVKDNLSAGAGITAQGGSVIDRNIVLDNAGVGIYCSGTGETTITSNIVARNHGAKDASQAGGIVVGGKCLVANNLVVDNNTATHGRGLDLEGPLVGSVVANNTIIGSPGATGYVLFAYLRAIVTPITIANNIVISRNGGGVYLYRSGAVPRTDVAVRNNDVISQKLRYTGITDPTGVEGNITADPLFVDLAGGNYHLAAGSPCADAGDDSVVQPDWTDVYGARRILGLHVDIGAVEG